MATNPVNIPIVQPASGAITCISNASYFQRVTLTWTANNNTVTVVFKGTGEGKKMQTQSGEFYYEVTPSNAVYEISALFEYSVSGPNGDFISAQVKDPIITSALSSVLILVTSEDFTDNDNNDSYLMISYNTPTRK